MAVRNDFTAGEVLAAADLNDTFAAKLPYSFGTATPSSPGDGEIWVDTSGSPNKPSVKFYDGAAFQPVAGLTLITSESFSAVSSVSLNGCFTTNYETYRILIRCGLTAAGWVYYRLRAAGSDATATNYNYQELRGSGTSTSAARIQNDAKGALVYSETNATSFADCIINGPQLAANTYSSTTANRDANTTSLQSMITMSNHLVATSYDGITIFPQSGTFTGIIRVYGYKD